MEMGFCISKYLPQMLWATLNTIMAAGIGYAIAANCGIIIFIRTKNSI